MWLCNFSAFPLLAFIELHQRSCFPTAMWDNLLSLLFLCETWNFCPTSVGKIYFALYKIQVHTTFHMKVEVWQNVNGRWRSLALQFVFFVKVEVFAPMFPLWKLQILSHIELQGTLQTLLKTSARLFLLTGMRGWGNYKFYLTKRGCGDGDGGKLTPVPVPIPARGLNFFPVPIPVRGGDFSPMRGGAQAGAGNPRPVANSRFNNYRGCFLAWEGDVQHANSLDLVEGDEGVNLRVGGDFFFFLYFNVKSVL